MIGMSEDERMRAWMDWYYITEGYAPHEDSKWWAAFAGVIRGIASQYAIDYLWYVATGETDNGMAELFEVSPEYRASTRADLKKLGAIFPDECSYDVHEHHESYTPRARCPLCSDEAD